MNAGPDVEHGLVILAHGRELLRADVEDPSGDGTLSGANPACTVELFEQLLLLRQL